MFKRVEGFSLFEILIALALTALVLGLVVSNVGNERKKLEEELDQLERMVRFAADESSLKNTLMRVLFDLEKNPKEYSVEIGPSGSFTIPVEFFSSGSTSKSLKESETEEKKIKELDSAFKSIPDLKERSRAVEAPTYLIGVGSSLTGQLHLEGSPSIFFYATGEKDATIIFLGNYLELAALKVDPLSISYQREFITLEDAASLSEDDLISLLQEKAHEVYSRWKKE